MTDDQSDLDPIVIDGAVVYKVQTMADGGIRLSVDLPENCELQAAHLMICQRQGVSLHIRLYPGNRGADFQPDDEPA